MAGRDAHDEVVASEINPEQMEDKSNLGGGTVRTKRLFVAIELSQEVQFAARLTCERIRRSASIAVHGEEVARLIRWVSPRNMHITLKFIGNVEEDRISFLEARLRDYVARSQVHPFEMNTAALGLFASSGIPRVLWQGVNGASQGSLIELAEAAREACIDCGISRRAENDRFNAHVTLARIKQPGRWRHQRPRRDRPRMERGGFGGPSSKKDDVLKQKLKNFADDFAALGSDEIFEVVDPEPKCNVDEATISTHQFLCPASMTVAAVSLMWNQIDSGGNPVYTCLSKLPLAKAG